MAKIFKIDDDNSVTINTIQIMAGKYLAACFDLQVIFRHHCPKRMQNPDPGCKDCKECDCMISVKTAIDEIAEVVGGKTPKGYKFNDEGKLVNL